MNQFGIVLLVSERSGSNLLRTLLGNHSQIVAPVAPHFLLEFYHCRHYYGDLREEQSVAKLMHDMIALANHPYHNWQLRYEFDVQNVPQVSPSSVITAMDFVYKQKALQENKHHYCSKGIHSFQFIDHIRAEVPDMKFVHLVRDPRDHVASWLKKPIHLLTAYDAVLTWKKEQEVLIDAIQRRNLDCISVQYEDLISDPQHTMTGILEYLDLPVEDQCFTTDTIKNSELQWNPYWENLSKPIMAGNKEKFKKELTDEEIHVIETITRQEMSFFDYTPVTSQDWKYSRKYEATLQRQRDERSKSITKKPFQELVDKLNFINNLKKERENEWLQQHRMFEWQDIPKPLALKTRLKYLSYAVLGGNVTKILRNSWKQ